MSFTDEDGPAELVRSAGLLLAAAFTGDIAGEEVNHAIQLATGSLTQIAVAARNEEARHQMSQGKVGENLIHSIHELIRWMCVNLPSAELLAQCIRAVGNLVVDHDVNRARVLTHGLVPQLIAAIFDSAHATSPSFFVPLSSPPTPETKLPTISGHPVACIRFACGAITNLCHTNNELLDAVVSADGVRAMVVALQAAPFDPMVCTFAVRALCMFTELPKAHPFFLSSAVAPIITQLGTQAFQDDNAALLNQICVLISLLDVKSQMSQLQEAGVVPFLLRCVKFPSDEDAVAIAALQALCPLISLSPSLVLSAVVSLLPPPSSNSDAISELQQLALDALVRVAPTPFACEGVSMETIQTLNELAGCGIDMFRKNSLSILEQIAQTEQVANIILITCYDVLANYAKQFTQDEQTSTLALGVLRRLSIYHSLRRQLVEKGLVPVLMEVCAAPTSEERNTGMFFSVRALYNFVSCSDDIALRSVVAASLTDFQPLLNLCTSSKQAVYLEAGRVLAHLALEPQLRKLFLCSSTPLITFKIMWLFGQMSLTTHYVLHAEVCRALAVLVPEVRYCDDLGCYEFSRTECLSLKRAACENCEFSCECAPSHVLTLASLCKLHGEESKTQEPASDCFSGECCGVILTKTLQKLRDSSPPIDLAEQLITPEELRASAQNTLARLEVVQ